MPESTRLSKFSRSIDGRVAIVTGAASGMGRATAYLFADEGAKVAVVDRTAEGVLAVVDAIRNAGRVAEGFVTDVSDPKAITDLVAGVRAKLGPVDILINNAGIAMPSPIEGDDWQEAWDATFLVNVTAHGRLVRACLADLKRNADGRIVNIASTEGLGATAAMSAYTAAKHAVIGITRSLAVELGPTGITVNCICPGPINTGMTSSIDDAAKAIFAKRRVPLRRYGDPEEVAQITLSLVLPAASYLNGVAIPVDGGMTIRNA